MQFIISLFLIGLCLISCSKSENSNENPKNTIKDFESAEDKGIEDIKDKDIIDGDLTCKELTSQEDFRKIYDQSTLLRESNKEKLDALLLANDFGLPELQSFLFLSETDLSDKYYIFGTNVEVRPSSLKEGQIFRKVETTSTEGVSTIETFYIIAEQTINRCRSSNVGDREEITQGKIYSSDIPSYVVQKSTGDLVRVVFDINEKVVDEYNTCSSPSACPLGYSSPGAFYKLKDKENAENINKPISLKKLSFEQEVILLKREVISGE